MSHSKPPPTPPPPPPPLARPFLLAESDAVENGKGNGHASSATANGGVEAEVEGAAGDGGGRQAFLDMEMEDKKLSVMEVFKQVGVTIGVWMDEGEEKLSSALSAAEVYRCRFLWFIFYFRRLRFCTDPLVCVLNVCFLSLSLSFRSG